MRLCGLHPFSLGGGGRAQEIIHALTGTVASVNNAEKTISVMQDNEVVPKRFWVDDKSQDADRLRQAH